MSLLKEVKSDRTEKVMELLQSSQDINVKDNKTGNTPLHFAIENQNMTILNALLSLETKPNLNITNNEGLTPLAYSASLSFGEGLEPLLKHGADPNFAPQQARTALHYAAVNNLTDAVKLLLRHHANINQKSEEGTALHIATQASNDDVAFLLMDNPNIDFSATDSEGNTFLHIAVESGSYNIFQKFFADAENKNLNISDLVNKTNSDGNTILHEAEIDKRTSIAQFLKENAQKFSLDVSRKNKDGFTAEECKQQHIIKAQEEEEKKKLRKEEAKEYRKQRKQEQDQFEEERRAQEKLMKKKELEDERKAKENFERQKKFKPLFSLIMVVGVFVLIYLALNHGIEKKKNNVMDL